MSVRLWGGDVKRYPIDCVDTLELRAVALKAMGISYRIVETESGDKELEIEQAVEDYDVHERDVLEFVIDGPNSPFLEAFNGIALEPARAIVAAMHEVCANRGGKW